MDTYTSGWDKFIKLGNNEISLDGSSDNLNLDIKAKGNGLISIGTNNGTPLIVNSTTVGIGTNPAPEYTLNVNGTLNCHSLVVNEHSVTGGNGGFLWDTENGTNNIYYNLGKVGIGNINPYYKLDFGKNASGGTSSDYGGMLALYSDIGGNNLCGIDADNYGYGPGLNFYASAGGKAEGNIKMKIHRDTGNVGIGTTSPEQKLDVRGGMRLGDGTSAEQYISYHNNIGNWRTGINNYGNGTSANQFYIYDNDYRLTVQKNTGYVGIGTPSPEQKLDVRGGMRLGDGTSAEQYISYHNNIGNWRTGINNYGNGTSANQFYIYDNDYRLTVQKNTGYVGIGTPSPEQKLDVRGGMRLGDGTSAEQYISYHNNIGNWRTGINNYGNGTSANQFYIYDNDYRLTVQKNTGYVGIGTPSPEQKLDVRGGMRLGDGTSAEQYISYHNNIGNWRTGINNYGNGTSANQFYIYDNDYRLTVQKNTGYVGIGTPSPEQKLDVRGGMRLGDGTSAEQYISYHNNIGNWRTGINNYGNGTSGNQFYIYDNDYRLTVQKGTGNVGIGTTLAYRKIRCRWQYTRNKFYRKWVGINTYKC
jgi:hypothetical protein